MSFANTELEDTFLLYEICDELGVSIDDARLYSYIFHMTDKHGLESITSYNDSAIQGILFLLGDKEAKENLLNFKADHHEHPNDVVIYKKVLSRFDIEEFDKVQTELLNRVRLHTDLDFQKEKITFYQSEVLRAFEEKKTSN